MSGEAHSDVHVPFEQISAGPQAFPHAPQFCVSVDVLVQVEPHSARGDGHELTTGSLPVQAMTATPAPASASRPKPTNVPVRVIVFVLRS